MEFLKVDSLEAAREKLLESAKSGLISTEVLPCSKTLGRVAAQDVFSPEDIPAFARSTVDGYAVLSSDTAGAGESIPVFLDLVGQIDMGCQADITISSGQCVEVFTGGMLPGGADSVVMIEYTEEFGSQGIAISQSARYGENVAQPGEDMNVGKLIIKRGRRILPQDLGALAAAGICEISVYSPVRVSVISTGDELVPPNKTPLPGQIRDVNSYALSALAQKHGLLVVSTAILPDEQDSLERAVRTAVSDSDIVVVSGGSSKGKKDMTRLVFDRLAAPGVYTHGIALKPGKPTILGYDSSSNTLLMGLPGHPVSALMVFELLVGWLLRTLMGVQQPPGIPARVSSNLAASPGKLTCVPCHLTQDSDGYIAQPVLGKSGMISTLTQADGYFIIPRTDEGVRKGQKVLVELF